MKKGEWMVAIFFVLVTCVFFVKVFSGRIPFPGDLLVAEYKPWRTYSYLGYNPGSYPHKAQYFDTLRQLYPWRTFSQFQIRNGSFPLWNPHNFAGSPHFANNQTGILYPFNILYMVLPQSVAWTAIMMMGTFLSSFGTYLFTRKLGLSKKSSILAGITYGYSMFMTTFLEYNSIHQVALWVPFLLLAIEYLLRSFSPAAIFLFCLFATSAAFGGHLQIFIYSMLFAGAYWIARIKMAKKKLHPMHVIVFILPMGLASAQLFPTFELILQSARAPQEYQFLVEKLLLAPYQFALLFAADIFGNPATHNYLLPDSYPGNSIYVGVLSILFAILAFKGWKNAFVRLFGIATAFIILTITRSPVTEILYRLPIPFFSTASPTNAIFLLSFCFSILAAFGLEAWFVKREKYTKRIIATTAIVFLLLWVAYAVDRSHINVKNLVFSTTLFIASALFIIGGNLLPKWRKYIVYGMIFLVLADNWYFFQKFNPFVPKELVFPPAPVATWMSTHAGYDRVWGVQNAAIEANFATQLGIYSPDGYDPLYPRGYGEFLGLAKTGSLTRAFTNMTRSDATLPAGDVTVLTDPTRRKVLNLLGIRYILDRVENASSESVFPPESYRLVYEQDGWKIFENRESIPRAFLAASYETYTDMEDFEKRFRAFDAKKTVLLNHNLNYALDAGAPTDIATIAAYNPNEVIIQTATHGRQLLVLTDTFYPGWKAMVDGTPQKILKANWTMRAVAIPPGNHTVTFTYDPASFSFGVKSSMMSLFILGILLYRARKNRHA